MRRARARRWHGVTAIDGSSTAVGRTLAALLNDGQRPDGTIGILEVLVPPPQVYRQSAPGERHAVEGAIPGCIGLGVADGA